MIRVDLPALGEVLGLPPVGPSDPLSGVSLGPLLETCYAPRRNWYRPWAPQESEDWQAHGRWARHSGPWGEGPPWACHPARNSDTPPKRNGWKGITGFGRKAVRSACTVLDDRIGRLAFWTVTLSSGQLDQLEALDSWPAFQNAIRHRLNRALRRKGYRPLVVGVVELHPQRSRDEGRPCPHLHICFQGRQHRRGRWALSLADLDRIIQQALAAAGVTDLDVKACGNTQGVKRSVARYLSKYLSKGCGRPRVCGRGFELCPRQWWFQTREMADLVRRCWIRLPLRFIAWIHRHHEQLELQELLWWRPIPLPDARAPSTYGVKFAGVAELALAVALWQECEWDAEWLETHELLHERSLPGQHPQLDQHLRTAGNVGDAMPPINGGGR